MEKSHAHEHVKLVNYSVIAVEYSGRCDKQPIPSLAMSIFLFLSSHFLKIQLLEQSSGWDIRFQNQFTKNNLLVHANIYIFKTKNKPMSFSSMKSSETSFDVLVVVLTYVCIFCHDLRPTLSKKQCFSIIAMCREEESNILLLILKIVLLLLVNWHSDHTIYCSFGCCCYYLWLLSSKSPMHCRTIKSCFEIRHLHCSLESKEQVMTVASNRDGDNCKKLLIPKSANSRW